MNEHPDTTQTTEIATGETPTPKEKRTTRFRPLIALLVGVAIAVGGYFGYERFNIPSVATVNGTKITEVELNENIDMMTKSAEMQGIDVSDPAITTEIRTQALTNLINNELLMSAARNAGVSTNEAAVKTAYDSLVTEVGGEEELKTRMESVGLTSETLMGNISDRLLVDQYIEAETDIKNITITDEEVETYLAGVTTEGVTLPPLEEIRPQIEATLIAEKQQQIVDALIEKLRSEASIEIKE
jgi:Arc/MetJ family transcription regulator